MNDSVQVSGVDKKSAETAAKAGKPKNKAVKTKDKGTKKVVTAPTWDFTGKIQNIKVGQQVSSSSVFTATLHHRKDVRTFMLDATDPVRFNALASVLTAAMSTRSKVRLKTVANGDGAPIISELEVRA